MSRSVNSCCALAAGVVRACVIEDSAGRVKAPSLSSLHTRKPNHRTEKAGGFGKTWREDQRGILLVLGGKLMPRIQPHMMVGNDVVVPQLS